MPSVCFEKDGGHFIWHFKNRVNRTGEAREGTKAGRKRPLGTSVLGEGERETDMRIGAKKSRRGPLQMPGLKWARNHRIADSGPMASLYLHPTAPRYPPPASPCQLVPMCSVCPRLASTKCLPQY